MQLQVVFNPAVALKFWAGIPALDRAVFAARISRRHRKPHTTNEALALNLKALLKLVVAGCAAKLVAHALEHAMLWEIRDLAAGCTSHILPRLGRNRLTAPSVTIAFVRTKQLRIMFWSERHPALGAGNSTPLCPGNGHAFLTAVAR